MRPSKWGNPFKIGRDGTRAEVIEKHYQYVCENAELMRNLCELEGKDLVCCCKPAPCHGDNYVKLLKQRPLDF